MDILGQVLLVLGAPKTDLPKVFAYFKARLVSPNNSFPIDPRPILFISSECQPNFDMPWRSARFGDSMEDTVVVKNSSRSTFRYWFGGECDDILKGFAVVLSGVVEKSIDI